MSLYRALFALSRVTLLGLLAVLADGRTPARAQSSATVAIDSPREGDVLSGTVEIRGSASAEGFSSAELAFAYAADATDPWFAMADISQPVMDGELAIWDTTSISDGDYVIRLRLVTTGGTVTDAVVRVQVRNYTMPSILSPTASPTSAPVLQVDTPLMVRASPPAHRAAPATPTPLPGNAASLTSQAILSGFSRGGLAVAALGVIVGALMLRRRSLP